MKEKVNLPEADYQKQAMSLEQYLIRHCAPTLASLKTANLFSCSFREQPDFSYCISYWNARMKDKGIKVVLLQKKNIGHCFMCIAYRSCNVIYKNRMSPVF